MVLAAHFVDSEGVRQVFLRSAVRPATAERDRARSPTPEADPEHGWFWELPAGLVEPGEQSREGVLRCAQRELKEELGFTVDLSEVTELGPGTFPVPGLIAERQYFFEIEVDPPSRAEPELDGSPLELFGAVVSLPLVRALELCADGTLNDGKTELGLRRLLERYGAGG